MRRVLPMIVLLAGAMPVSPIAPASAAAPACAHQDEVPTLATLAPARRATLCLINVARASRGLPIVHTTAPLRGAAKRYARVMMNHDFFSHVTPGGLRPRDRARRSGYPPAGVRALVGENLGWGRDADARPTAIVAKWLRSPSHARVLLNPVYRDVGIGVAFGAPVAIPPGHTAATYAIEFGRLDPP